MKCTDHPFYPRRYCYGCSERKRSCAACGKKESGLIEMEVETAAGECERIEVCGSCRDKILSMDGRNKTQMYLRQYERREAGENPKKF
jgi:hypothetical protein